MSNCKQCEWLDDIKVECAAPVLKAGSGLCRKCDMAVVIKTGKIATGMVLEIGPGVNQSFRRKVWKNGDGNVWVGVDPHFGDRPLKKRYHGKATKIPFGDEAFDLVGTFNSMEHWYGFGDSIECGLKEVLRVLKPGGMFVATVPIHSHGHDMFVLGNYDAIRECFNNDWVKVEFEDWRKESDPLPPAFPSEKEIKALRKIIPVTTKVNEWLLEIRAWKKW
jgi:SAM-dependent methyltransferase